MGLIGLSHNESLKEKPLSVKSGVVIVCQVPTSTLTKGKEYKVLGHFAYHKKQFDLGDHWWNWFEFYTLKNNEGYTIKVNKRKFELKSQIEKEFKEREVYENNAINILMEAQGLINEKY
jgi:hypothetical protein